MRRGIVRLHIIPNSRPECNPHHTLFQYSENNYAGFFTPIPKSAQKEVCPRPLVFLFSFFKREQPAVYDFTVIYLRKKIQLFDTLKFSLTQGNTPHKLCSYSPEPRTEVYCVRLNFGLLLNPGPHKRKHKHKRSLCASEDGHDISISKSIRISKPCVLLMLMFMSLQCPVGTCWHKRSVEGRTGVFS